MTVQQKYNNDFHPQRFAETVMRTEFPSLHCVSNGLHALWLFFHSQFAWLYIRERVAANYWIQLEHFADEEPFKSRSSC